MTSQTCMLPALDVLFSDLKSSYGVAALCMDIFSWFQSALPLFSSFLVPLNPFWGERADLAQNIWNVSTLWIYTPVLWCLVGFFLVFFTVIPCNLFPLLPVTEQWANAAVTYLLQLPSSCVKNNSHDIFLFLSCFKTVGTVEIYLLGFYYEDSETRVICYLSLTHLTGFCRLIQQLIETCFNAVVHNLLHNSGGLFLLKFFTKVVCHLGNIALTWIASLEIGGITFTFWLAPASWLCSLLTDKKICISHN